MTNVVKPKPKYNQTVADYIRCSDYIVAKYPHLLDASEKVWGVFVNSGVSNESIVHPEWLADYDDGYIIEFITKLKNEFSIVDIWVATW